jgi:hypothetical protein
MTDVAYPQHHSRTAAGISAGPAGLFLGLRSKSPLLRTLLLLIAAGLAGWAAYARTERYLGVLEPDRVIAIDDFPEISGIAWWPARGTLIGVGDNGEVAELTLQGRVLRKRIHEKRDFEDVYLLPGSGQALAIDEQHNRLVTLRLDDLGIEAERSVPHDFSLTRHRNKSFEGMAMAGNPPRLILANESPPAVIMLDPHTGDPQRTMLLGAKSVSGVITGPQGELLLVSRENGLLLLDADGNTVGDGWHPVEYHHIEGAALVPGFGLVLCIDRNPGVLLVFSAIRDWQDLRHVFAR